MRRSQVQSAEKEPTMRPIAIVSYKKGFQSLCGDTLNGSSTRPIFIANLFATQYSYWFAVIILSVVVPATVAVKGMFQNGTYCQQVFVSMSSILLTVG